MIIIIIKKRGAIEERSKTAYFFAKSRENSIEFRTNQNGNLSSLEKRRFPASLLI